MPELTDLMSLEVSDDELVATLVVAPGFVPSPCDREAILAILQEHGVRATQGVHTAVESLLEALGTHPDETNSVVVASGTLAEHGQNGRLVWVEAFDPENSAPRPTPGVPEPGGTSGHASHYNRSVFTMAREGDVIARLHPPTSGADGTTVRGKTIAAKPGKPAPVTLDASVVVRENGDVVARWPGAVQYAAGELKVISHLEIDEFVDFSTGNIEFDGDITVHKGVRDCFIVRASKDVKIRGMVEAAEVVCGRDGVFEGGIAARDKGSVIVERDMSARYIDSAVIAVGRHLTVEKEIVNTKLAVGGSIDCARGAFIGGECTVGGASEFGELGAQAGAETSLALGSMKDFNDLKDRLQGLGSVVDDLHRKAQQQYDLLVANASRLTATQAEQMTELEFSLSALKRLRGNMSKADGRIDGVVSTHTDVALTVHRLIHRNVHLRLGDYQAHFKEPIKGPVRITLGANGRPVLTDLVNDSTRELADVARVVEIDPAARSAA